MESDESEFNSCDYIKKNFKFLGVLGRGGFATVYHAKSKKAPQLEYAIKYSNNSSETFNEILILSKLGKGSEHGHIISIYDEYQNNHKDGKSVIVMEKARESLADIIKKNKKKGSIDKMLLMQIFMDI